MIFCLDARAAQDHFPGVGRYVLNLARAMPAALSASERLVLLRDPTSSAPWNLASLADTRLQLTDAAVSPFSARQQWRVPHVLRQLGAQLYHSPYYLMPLRAGVPSVVTIHDLIPLRFPGYFNLRDRLIYRTAIRLAVRAASAIVAVSETTARDLTQLLHVPSKRIVVIPEAAGAEFAPQPAEIVAATQARLSLPERYVLYLGSNKPHKNLPRLIEAWSRLQPHPLPLVIAGVWDERYPQARVRADALDLGERVRFVGAIAAADLPALYSGAVLFVFPSEYEGFGLPVIEAMACGAPVACAKTGSLAEVVGGAARGFDPHEVDAIAAAMRALLHDAELRADLSARGLRRARQFSWQDAAGKTLEVYRSLLRA